MQTVVMAIFDTVMLLLEIAGFFLIVLYCIKWGIEEFGKEEEKKKKRKGSEQLSVFIWQKNMIYIFQTLNLMSLSSLCTERKNKMDTRIFQSMFLLAIVLVMLIWIFYDIRYKKKHSEADINEISDSDKTRVRIYDNNNGYYIEVVGQSEISIDENTGIETLNGTNLTVEYFENFTLIRQVNVGGTAEIVFDKDNSNLAIIGNNLNIDNIQIYRI